MESDCCSTLQNKKVSWGEEPCVIPAAAAAPTRNKVKLRRSVVFFLFFILFYFLLLLKMCQGSPKKTPTRILVFLGVDH